MLASLTPLGERGRNTYWPATVTFYFVGSTVGGAALGSLLGLVGSPVVGALDPVVPMALLAFLVLGGFLLDIGIGWKLPTVQRQVSQAWLGRYRGWVVGLGFGFQLGLGFITIVTTSTVYAVFLSSLLSGDPVAGALIGGTFGLLRATPLLAGAMIRTSADLDRLEPTLQRLETPVRDITLAGQLVLVSALIVTTVLA